MNVNYVPKAILGRAGNISLAPLAGSRHSLPAVPQRRPRERERDA